jgi:hypothetical protein
MSSPRALRTVHAFTGLCLVSLLLAAAAPAQAQWKWKDRNGQTHISDLPPPRDIPDKDVLQRPSEARRAAAAAAAATPASAPAASAAIDRKSTRLNSSHNPASRMPSSA